MTRGMYMASADGLPQSRQDKASRSLTARRCRKNERQMKITSDRKKPNSPPQAFPLLPSKKRVVPLAPYIPTPKPHWPLHLRLLSQVGLASVIARKTRTAWLHRSSASSSAILVRSRPRVGPGSFLVSSRTAAQRGFCWLRHWDSS